MFSISQAARTSNLNLSRFLAVPRLNLGRVLRFPKISLSKFLQMKLNVVLFRVLPFSISRWYIATLGKVYYLLHRQEKKLIRKTIWHVFKGRMPGQELRRRTKAAFKGIFDHYHEKLFVGYSNFPRLLNFLRTRIRFQGEDALLTALEKGKGAILVTGHYGAVEFLPGFLAVHGYPASMICRFQTNRLRVSLSQRAQWVGLDLIDADEGNIILTAMKALKQGRILITECDEFDEWRPDPNRDSQFLNCHLTSDRSLELLQKRSGAPVVSALMQREGNRSYTCKLKAVPVPGAVPVNLALSDQCLRVLETSVEGHPEQWYQWKKFGKMVKSQFEAAHVRQESGYLAPEAGISVPHQP